MVKRKKRRSKKRDREEDYVEKLEAEVRELKSINRSLLKQLKKLARGIHKEEYEQTLEEIGHGKKKEDDIDRGPTCPQCQSKRIIETSIAGRRFQRCQVCDWKSGRIK